MVTIKNVDNFEIVATKIDNYFSDVAVEVFDGSKMIYCDIYTGYSPLAAINDILEKLDYYTLGYIFMQGGKDLKKINDDLYRSDIDLFSRVKNTEYFKHSLVK